MRKALSKLQQWDKISLASLLDHLLQSSPALPMGMMLEGGGVGSSMQGVQGGGGGSVEQNAKKGRLCKH